MEVEENGEFKLAVGILQKLEASGYRSGGRPSACVCRVVEKNTLSVICPTNHNVVAHSR